jgi:hypothetical protein
VIVLHFIAHDRIWKRSSGVNAVPADSIDYGEQRCVGGVVSWIAQSRLWRSAALNSSGRPKPRRPSGSSKSRRAPQRGCLQSDLAAAARRVESMVERR